LQNTLRVSLSDCIDIDMARTVPPNFAFIDEKTASTGLRRWYVL